MGFWSSFGASWRKSSNLKRISLALGSGKMPMTVADLMQTSQQHGKAEEQLFDLVECDPSLQKIMEKHGATRDVLRKSYRALCVSGAAQHARGHWVPASALVFGTTLDFVLSSTRNAEENSRNVWLPVAFRLIEYFEKGEVGPVRS